MMMNELFALTADGKTCTVALVKEALQNIINMQEGVYLSQLAMLSPRQKQLLQAIAQEKKVKSVTSTTFIKKYSLDSASSVQSALKGLIEKDLISSSNGLHYISDYFFSIWLKNSF